MQTAYLGHRSWLTSVIEGSGYRPLTELVLTRLGRSRRALVVGLLVLPWARDLIVYLLFRDGHLVGEGWLASRAPTALTNSYLIALSIWGAARVARKLAALHDADGRLDTDARAAAWPSTWSAKWLVPPILLAVLMTAVVEAGRVVELGAPAATATPLPFVINALLGFVMRLAPMTGFWTAVLVLGSLARLGVSRVRPEDFPPDRSLGMRPVGDLAFDVFWMSTAAFIPMFLFRSPSLLDVVLTLVFFVVAGAVLVVALWHLHVAMARTKAICLDAARTRHAKAYRMALEDADGRDVERRAHALAVAEALQRGAESIHEWPLDERMIRWVALIGAGVTTGVVVRLLSLSLGV